MLSEEELVQELREMLESYTAGVAGTGRAFLAFSDGREGGFHVRETYMECQVWFSHEPFAWIPEEMIESALLEGDKYRPEMLWDNTGDRTWSTGWMPAYSDLHLVRIQHARSDPEEYITDVIRTKLSDAVDAGPKDAIRTMERWLGRREPELLKKVRKAKLPEESLASLAVAMFEHGGDEEGLDLIRRAMGDFGYEGTRGTVLVEVDRAVLREIGITSGKWWDRAPLKLVNLPADELAYEGVLMRHCIGRYDMPYISQVERGVSQVWSLRSRDNKPLLTWEVSVGLWHDAGADPCLRGYAVEQLKGKANRLSGKTRDEAKVLALIFSLMQINPRCVGDFEGDTLFADLFGAELDEGETQWEDGDSLPAPNPPGHWYAAKQRCTTW